MFSLLRNLLPTTRPALRPRLLPRLEGLEAREVPTVNPVSLGTAGHYAVLGLQNTDIINGNGTIKGDEGVSRGGSLLNRQRSTIDGDVHAAARGQYSGRGDLTGSVLISASEMRTADDDAADGARAAAALTPTKTLNSVTKATTVTGNGGVNVIKVKGDISASLKLTGTADDIFIVNVSGDLDLKTRSSLSLGGGVTADHVLYNFVGKGGDVRTRGNSVVDGTLLAVNRDIYIGGDVNGRIIGGGREIILRDDTTVNFETTGGDTGPQQQTAELSGVVWADDLNTGTPGVIDPGEIRLGNATILLVNSSGQSFIPTTRGDDGSFSFTGLAPGTYQLSVSGYIANTITPGTVGGTTRGVANLDTNTINSIVLAAGDHGVNYLFGEMPPF